MHQSGALKQCKPDKHINPDVIHNCAVAECGKKICSNCWIEGPNQKLYCLQCYSTNSEIQYSQATVQEEEEDDEDFDDMF